MKVKDILHKVSSYILKFVKTEKLRASIQVVTKNIIGWAAVIAFVFSTVGLLLDGK